LIFESINNTQEVMTRVQFTNMVQLKLIEEKYGLSSLFQPQEFGVAFLEFVSEKGPQKLREVLNEHEYIVDYHVSQDKPLTHEELVYLSKQIFGN
jgi:hypothetical protein